ncbi:Tetratricopeptide repeat-containing protein [Nitrosospira sp. Nl5]|uniref:nuclear transport factor 2 family protein n=1 Tax=Nitrosospira sp. Nl5 TaxID=200120 RepID=UPI00088D13B0|nr:nuclear transport factor 2 family protein [Nitrosospira sp. Nl5]SCX85245.1 Tetratricopeptide repeat-containing protein [Nitrosospira sp. Nl5]
MKTLNFHRVTASIAVALLLTSFSAFADENEEVAKLYKQGNLAKALEQAETYLATKPKDAQMRFQKGLILTEQNKIAEAIKVFSSLSEDYPELPEPYNNLAVLYASQGQYDKAKVALESAIRTHPSYSTAHENLGDIYAKMASQAYGKALQLDKGNAAAQTKLAMIKDLFTGRSKGIQTASAQSPSDTSAQAKEKTAGKAPEKASEKTSPEAPEKLVPEKTPIAEKPAPEKSTIQDEYSEEVVKTVNAWAKAWSGKDITAYLAFYASDFDTPRGMSRSAWEKSRRERIGKPKSIHVEIASPKVSFPDATHAKVSFKQSYHSDAIKSTTNKTLEMVKIGGKWLIQQEQVGR